MCAKKNAICGFRYTTCAFVAGSMPAPTFAGNVVPFFERTVRGPTPDGRRIVGEAGTMF